MLADVLRRVPQMAGLVKDIRSFGKQSTTLTNDFALPGMDVSQCVLISNTGNSGTDARYSEYVGSFPAAETLRMTKGDTNAAPVSGVVVEFDPSVTITRYTGTVTGYTLLDSDVEPGAPIGGPLENVCIFSSFMASSGSTGHPYAEGILAWNGSVLKWQAAFAIAGSFSGGSLTYAVDVVRFPV